MQCLTPIRPQRATLQILPCTVSQLLSASEVNDAFVIGDCEVNQVSVVGVIRGFVPFLSNVQHSVDDMTGPPIDVKQWVNTEDSGVTSTFAPGTYVKVSGSLRNLKGQRSLLANDIRCVEDLNEITSHMLEVVQSHMQLFGKAADMNMNTTAASMSTTVQGYNMRSDGHSEGILQNGLSTIQGQVLSVIRRCSHHDEGISFQDLRRHLGNLNIADIRKSLNFLVSEGHVFTVDEHHFKSTDYETS
ncbi:replication protein A 32 kDa subunit-like [Centroberyx affinis]|uniref:replication protein A 32 kDa subunit-like n=1 Tax=Centroberyx affinis TaxID=166261 RepID=UPI003A5C199B